MNLKSIGSHTFDVDRLPRSQRPLILDVGCRGHEFLRDLRQHVGPVTLYGVDPDENVHGAINVAIIGTGSVTQSYARFSTGEGNHLGSGYGIPDCSPKDVPCMTIDGLSRVLGVKHWDAVKLDCEGAEFGILENWPGPIATQISVEFHDYLEPKRWNDEYFAWLFGQLPDYAVVQHKASLVTDQRGHWDTLLILKGAL